VTCRRYVPRTRDSDQVNFPLGERIRPLLTFPSELSAARISETDPLSRKNASLRSSQSRRIERKGNQTDKCSWKKIYIYIRINKWQSTNNSGRLEEWNEGRNEAEEKRKRKERNRGANIAGRDYEIHNRVSSSPLDIGDAPARSRFWRICTLIFLSLSLSLFSFFRVINCLRNVIDALVPWTDGSSAIKKEKRHARSVHDRRARARNEYRGVLFIVHPWQLNNMHSIHVAPQCSPAART